MLASLVLVVNFNYAPPVGNNSRRGATSRMCYSYDCRFCASLEARTRYVFASVHQLAPVYWGDSVYAFLNFGYYDVTLISTVSLQRYRQLPYCCILHYDLGGTVPAPQWFHNSLRRYGKSKVWPLRHWGGAPGYNPELRVYHIKRPTSSFPFLSFPFLSFCFQVLSLLDLGLVDKDDVAAYYDALSELERATREAKQASLSPPPPTPSNNPFSSLSQESPLDLLPFPAVCAALGAAGAHSVHLTGGLESATTAVGAIAGACVGGLIAAGDDPIARIARTFGSTVARWVGAVGGQAGKSVSETAAGAAGAAVAAAEEAIITAPANAAAGLGKSLSSGASALVESALALPGKLAKKAVGATVEALQDTSKAVVALPGDVARKAVETAGDAIQSTSDAAITTLIDSPKEARKRLNDAIASPGETLAAFAKSGSGEGGGKRSKVSFFFSGVFVDVMLGVGVGCCDVGSGGGGGGGGGDGRGVGDVGVGVGVDAVVGVGAGVVCTQLVFSPSFEQAMRAYYVVCALLNFVLLIDALAEIHRRRFLFAAGAASTDPSFCRKRPARANGTHNRKQTRRRGVRRARGNTVGRARGEDVFGARGSRALRCRQG